MIQLSTKRTLTLEAAKAIGAACEAEAAKNGWNVVIAVLDDGGHLIYLARMDGTQIGSVDVAQQKAGCALRFKRPSKVFADMVRDGATGMMGLRGVIAVEGGVPLLMDAQIVGAVGVSGVKSDQDGVVARAGAEAMSTFA